jgi:AcrR family transcriptional regulator
MGRPHKALLDRARIAEAAMGLVDRTGDFTVPALARDLGVQTASIYHHVEGRAGIVELLRTRIGEDMDFSSLEDRPWDTALAAFARSYRAAFAAHPRLVPLLTTSTVRAPGVIAAYERIAVLLASAGFRAEEAITALTALENLIIGSALDASAPHVMWEIPQEVAAPALAAALAAGPTGQERADLAFELGLEALLGHFRARLAEGDTVTG